MKKREFRVGDKVKVMAPCSSSSNKPGDIGYITEIRLGRLVDFGECIIHHIGLTPDDVTGGRYEHKSALKLLKAVKD